MAGLSLKQPVVVSPRIFAMRALQVGALAAAVAAQNNRPIIGIMSLPNDIPGYEKYNSYFAASYVKWLEQAGARVVPLLFDSDLDTLRATLKNINGALFTGGGAALTNPDGSLTQVGLAGQAIFNESLTSWAAGETWPLWGTCQGHELVSILASGVDASILTPFDAENITLPLTFTPAASSSRLYGGLSPQVISIFANEPVTMNNHMYGVAPADFYAATPLASRFNILSNNTDREGKTFVSSMEGKGGLPVYTTQYHPEKVQFEWWDQEVINHSYDSIMANRELAYFFVEQSRSNTRAFPTPDAESAALIYNYDPIYTAAIDPSFVQCYVFPPAQ